MSCITFHTIDSSRAGEFSIDETRAVVTWAGDGGGIRSGCDSGNGGGLSDLDSSMSMASTVTRFPLLVCDVESTGSMGSGDIEFASARELEFKNVLLAFHASPFFVFEVPL